MAANYIPGENPWSLPRPPAWYLNGLQRFDRDLVMVASRTKPMYRLCRRIKYAPGLGPDAIADRHGDGALFVQHHIVPTDFNMVYNGRWELQPLLNLLRKADTWQHGGPRTGREIERAAKDAGNDPAVKALESQERDYETSQRETQRDNLYHLTGEGWESLQRRLGHRISAKTLQSPVSPPPVQPDPEPVSAPVVTP